MADGKQRYVALLALLGAAFVGLSSWSLWRANSHSSPVSDPDYYLHGLQHDQEAAKLTEGSTWRVESKVEGDDLWVSLADARGAPLERAHAVLYVVENRTDGAIVLDERAPGRYVAQLNGRLRRPITLRLEVEHGEGRLERTLYVATP